MRTRNPHRSNRTPVSVVACCVLLAAAVAAVAGDLPNRGPAYARMAPVEQYLMDPSAEIALARSAAPAAISASATVLILKPQGYETAAAGTDGFTCIVERSWMSPFDNPEFWNPRIRGPVCYNPAASNSVLLYTLWRTKRALAGHSRERLLDETRAALASKELPSPATGAMSYMMSKDQYLADDAGHWHSHLMFHVPKVAAASWGANLPGSPVIFDNREMPEQAIFMVPVAHWSDGSEAPVASH
jgi:hypothetical protein